MLGRRKATTSADKPDNGIRRLKLTPLEGLLGGLIAVGLLYLFSVWMGAFNETGQDTTPAEGASRTQVVRAIAASEKALARLDAFENDLDTMRRSLDEAGIKPRNDPGGLLPGVSSGGGQAPAPDPKVTRKLIELENRVDTLVNTNPASEKALADRVGRLERSAEQGQKEDQARLDQVNQALGKLDDRLKNLNSMVQSGDDATQARLKELEQGLAKAEAAAPGALPADAAKRLDELDKRLAELAKAEKPTAVALPADAAKRLDELDKRLAELAKAEKAAPSATAPEITKRLDELDKRLAELAKAEKPTAVTLPADAVKRLDAVEDKLTALNQTVAAEAVDKRLAQVDSRLDKADQGLDKGLQTLGERLDKLDARMANLAGAANEQAADQAKVEALAGRIAQLEQRVAQVKEAEGAVGQADARAVARLDAMENTVAALSARVGGTRGGPEMAQRVESLETEVAWLKEDAPDKDAAKKARAEMDQRISRLETNTARLIRTVTRVQAQEPDDATEKRLETLERNLAKVSAADAQALAKRQEDLDKRMDALAGVMANAQDEAALNRRLTTLEARLNRLAAGQGPAPAASRQVVAAAPTPVRRVVYTVEPGDTLYRVARRHGVTVEDIQKWNPEIGQGDKIGVGQELVILTGQTQ